MSRRTSSNILKAFFLSAGVWGLAAGATARADQAKDLADDTSDAAKKAAKDAQGQAEDAAKGAAQDAQQKIQETVSGGEAKVTKSQLSGEVVSVSGNSLVAKMDPNGEERVFTIAPGKKFIIDGQEKSLSELQPGTKLSAEVTTTETPLIQRTKMSLSGRVFWSSATSVILTDDKGENKQYKVPASAKFNVDGQDVTASQLQRGTKVTATKIVEEPTSEISQEASVTGTAPQPK